MSTEEVGFLEAIAHAPAEDVHSLVYADWLDDAGQARRAEYVRGMVRLANGQVPEEEYDTLVGRLKRMSGRDDAHWQLRFATARASLPFRFRVRRVSPLGLIRDEENDYTYLHGVLESGTARLGEVVSIPLKAGGTIDQDVFGIEFFNPIPGAKPLRAGQAGSLDCWLDFLSHAVWDAGVAIRGVVRPARRREASP